MAKIRVPQVRGGYRYTTFVCKDKLSQVRGKIYNICIAKLILSHTNVVYIPLTCANQNLAIKMLHILLLPVAL
jgi:hypothetical protein